MKTSIKTILLSVTILLLTTTSISSESTPISEILGENEDTNQQEELNQTEEERESSFLNQLRLEIPEITDNPSHTITFIDPSEENDGVELEIDGKSFVEITSPYQLPALSIGEHQLRFRFVDEYGSRQIIEKDIIVIPRPPITYSPSITEGNIKINGTALSNSELFLLLTTGREIITVETEVDGDGKWDIEIDREELSDQIYSFTAYIRKNGYSSNLAETTTFALGVSENEIQNNNSRNDILFSFNNIDIDSIPSIILSNPDLAILLVSVFALGFLISFIFKLPFRDYGTKRQIKEIEKKVGKKKEPKGKELTLKERLSQQKDNEAASTEEKSKKKGKKENEKVVKKEDFLKDFKKFDPDNEKGEEKKNIKVTLTSKD